MTAQDAATPFPRLEEWTRAMSLHPDPRTREIAQEMSEIIGLVKAAYDEFGEVGPTPENFGLRRVERERNDALAENLRLRRALRELTGRVLGFAHGVPYDRPLWFSFEDGERRVTTLRLKDVREAAALLGDDPE